MWADALEHIVFRVKFKALWQINLRQRDTLQAISLLAYLAEKMGMLIVVMVMVVTVAELVLRAVATAFDGMHQMVLAEKRQGAEHIRLVDGTDPVLQLSQRLGQHGGCQRLYHYNTVGGGFDVMLFEQSDAVCFVHYYTFVGKGTTILVENERDSEKLLIFATRIQIRNCFFMRRKAALTLKILGGIVGAVLLLLLVAAVLLNTHAVQSKLVGLATERLEEKLQTRVKIDDVSVNVLTQEINLKGLEVEDQQQRKMLELERLSVSVDLWALMSKKLIISKADMEGVRAKLYKPEDGEANYQFILDAFKGDKPKKTQTDTVTGKKKKEPFSLNVHHVKLARIGGQFDYHTKKGPQTAKFNLSSLLIDEKGENHDLVINGLHFILDNHKPRKNTGKPHRGWFDVGHFDVTANLKMTFDYLEKDSVHATLTHFVAKDSLTGFNVKDLHFTMGATKKQAHLRNIVVQQESTVLQFDSASVVLPSKKEGRKFSFKTSLIKGKTQLKDISRPFAPVLKTFTMPLELSVLFSGTDSTLAFRNIEVHTPDQRLKINAFGDISGLKKKEDLNIHFHVNKMTAKGKVKQEILNQFKSKKMMMKQLDALGDLTLTGNIYVFYRREAFDGNVKSAAGGLRFNFAIDENTKYLTGNTETKSLHLGKVLNMKDVGNVGLNGNFKIDIHKKRTARMRQQTGGKLPFGEINATVYEVSYKKIKVKDLLVDIKCKGSLVEGNVSQQNKGLDWACDFSFTDIDKIEHIKVKPKVKVKFKEIFKKKDKKDKTSKTQKQVQNEEPKKKSSGSKLKNLFKKKDKKVSG